jgi:hypothetical protein
MNKQEIVEWLTKYNITKYIINDDLTVDVDGEVDLKRKCLYRIPVQFGTVAASFTCAINYLTSLKNCPHTIGGNFYCSVNDITSFQYCPKYIGGSFFCVNNNSKPTSVVGLLESNIAGDIFVDGHVKQTPDYQLLMKLREL